MAVQPACAGVAVPMAQPMAQPRAASSVMVVCPPGLKPGDMVQVAGPGGQMMQVPVPVGVPPGGQFMVQVPAAPTVVMAQAMPVMAAPGAVVMGEAV